MDITKSIYLVLITLLLSEVETQNTKKDISMAQQMLSDMGLNQRPDIKNVSFFEKIKNDSCGFNSF